ncbi:MAG: NAD(P)-dependent oxidoreductase [Verrucomicrobiota bacterium]|jgi:dTDP-4-dehydrorhamnose reductase
MRRKETVLLLGHTGKMGLALRTALAGEYEVIGRSSNDFDAFDPAQTRQLVESEKPDIVINAVAFLGIDACEKEPERALRLNALHPKLLAELSRREGFLLVHFSTDSVFSDTGGAALTEADCPRPLNVYGLTKHGGDCFIQAAATRYYIFRLPVLFGEATKDRQFVERMLAKCRAGCRVLRVADDIVSSPTYSRDAAEAIAGILASAPTFGVYHLANQGRASLFELMREVVDNLGLEVEVKRASHKDFPSVGIKNTRTPIQSSKIPALRPWQEAVKEYCAGIRAGV